LILIDSNLWAYFLDATVPEHSRARVAVGKVLAQDETLHSTVVQLEVLHYLATRLRERAGPTIDKFLSLPGPVELLTPEVVVETGKLLVKYRSRGVGGRDLAILVQAKGRGAAVASADRRLLEVGRDLGVETIAPMHR